MQYRETALNRNCLLTPSSIKFHFEKLINILYNTSVWINMLWIKAAKREHKFIWKYYCKKVYILVYNTFIISFFFTRLISPLLQ